MEKTSHKGNSFDLIRHLAALTVIISHQHAFQNVYEESFRGFLSYAGVGVVVFFSISGFLVAQSFQRSNGFVDFMEKRIRRIFPGLIACSFVIVYLLAPFYYGDMKLAYLSSMDVFKNFLAMSAMMQIHIPLLFEGYKHIGPPNGSLWTLPIEFSCYLIIALAMGLVKNWRSMAFMLFLMIAGSIALSDQQKQAAFYGVSTQWLIQFGTSFFLGALLSLTREAWDNTKTKLFFVFFALFCLYMMKGMQEILVFGYVALTLITIVIGVSFKERLIKGRFDISYGLYIYAWPVQQIMANETHMNYWWSLFASIIVITALATLSWHFVEKPFLRRSSAKPGTLASAEAR